MEYNIAVTTSSGLFAGTDDNVSINLIGSLGRTEKRKLKASLLKNAFEAGKTDKFSLKCMDVGLLQQE